MNDTSEKATDVTVPDEKRKYSIEESRINFLFFISFVLFLIISLLLLFVTNVYKEEFNRNVFEPIGVLLLGVSVCGMLTIMFANYMNSYGHLESHGAYIKGALAMFVILFFSIGSSYYLLSEDVKNTEEEINKKVNEIVNEKIDENHEKVIGQLKEVIPNLGKIGNLYFVTQCSKLPTDKITYESISFDNKEDDIVSTSKGIQVKANTKINKDILISAKSLLDDGSLLFQIIYNTAESLVIIKFNDVEELLNICQKQRATSGKVTQSVTPTP
ncbi:hypothetical protein [Photobacterium indicum]|nr:hypothetical protein [Photobacterium indicum]